MSRVNESFRKVVDDLICECIKESLQDEDRVVKFNGRTYPKFNQAVIMVGGSGSGKSFCRKSGIIPLDAKTFDTDDFKDKYIHLQNVSNSKIGKEDKYQYNLANDEDVTKLHLKVKGKGWDWKTQDAFLYDTSKSSNRLPNCLFDITGKDEDKLIDIAQTCRDLGYEITLVWVVVNRSRALWQNLSRPRRVKQDVFHNIHNQVNVLIPNFIKSKAAMYVDNVWLVFNSSETLGQKTDEENKNTAVSLQRKGNGFEIEPQDEERLFKILGENEPNPKEPQRYWSYDEIKNDPNFSSYNYKYKGSKTFKK